MLVLLHDHGSDFSLYGIGRYTHAGLTVLDVKTARQFSQNTWTRYCLTDSLETSLPFSPIFQDFSAGDLKLALNAGIPFQTPEQFFMRSTQPLHKNRYARPTA